MHARAGQPAQPEDLIDVDEVVSAYYDLVPDPAVPAQKVVFGTSGHRGSSLDTAFNEAHIVATTAAIVEYRRSQGTDGTLYLGRDTHALSEPAWRTAVEVLAGAGVTTAVDARGAYTPTPAVSHSILLANGAGTEAGVRTSGPGLADGIVVTCSTTSSCRGWMQTSGEWTNLWTTTTNPQTSYGLSNQGLGYAPAGTTRSGTGELASVLVPFNYQEAPQIINIHTGKTTYLPSPDQSGLGQYVEVATDGFVIIDVSKKQGFLTDSSGARQSTFSTDEYLRLPAVSRDGSNPSTADIKTFMTTKTANWATGTVGLVGKDDCSIQVTLTSDGSSRTTPVPGVLSQHMTSTCLFSPKEVRVSADGSVLYADTFTYQDQSRYFIDTANGLTYTSNLLNLPKQTMWVFDDMLIGASKTGVTAFVPASS